MNEEKHYARCKVCDREMVPNGSCLMIQIRIGNKWYQRSTEHFGEPSGYCYDCNAKHGSYHHWGCDVESCPKCGGQMLGCPCLEEEKEGIEFRSYKED